MKALREQIEKEIARLDAMRPPSWEFERHQSRLDAFTEVRGMIDTLEASETETHLDNLHLKFDKDKTTKQ